ncbi:MAG: hypothetical protein R2792_10795 [Saprospiraceae bacterium]
MKKVNRYSDEFKKTVVNDVLSGNFARSTLSTVWDNRIMYHYATYRLKNLKTQFLNAYLCMSKEKNGRRTQVGIEQLLNTNWNMKKVEEQKPLIL